VQKGCKNSGFAPFGDCVDSADDAQRAVAGRALLVCSPGGHLAQMLSLEPAWRDLETTWVTLPGADVDYLLAGQDVVLGRGPTNRSIKNLVRNFRTAWRTVRDRKPDVILSTGAALAVPFFLVGRLHRRRCVYVESFTRIEGLSRSGRIVYPLAHVFFVQWPSLTERFRKAVYAGSVL
jgi:beta-1,4-N-acetylglucosaminyltransferase